MNKLFIILFLAFGFNAQAQITLEHVYDHASTVYSQCRETSQLMMVKFEVSGDRYVKVNRCGKLISIYDLNHSLIKTISMQNLPTTDDGRMGDFLYISEHLFNNDPNIEFMYSVLNTSAIHHWFTGIYNEYGDLIFSDSAVAGILTNYIQQQYPIYNTSQGTKMILSYTTGDAKVFSLPGTLSFDIAKANNALLQQNSISDAYPNPTANTTQIDYNLPNGINEGEIILFDLSGTEVKRFKVDRTFSSLLVSVADIPAGTYYYQLQTVSHNSEGKKMVVIK
jgi:hypothetical protein